MVVNAMVRSGSVYIKNVYCGKIVENEDGYLFTYDANFLLSSNAVSVSLTLPLTNKPYKSKTLFAFFDGLIPEGWLLDIAEKNWKINYRDRMGLLLTCCEDCIGSVSIKEDEKF